MAQSGVSLSQLGQISVTVHDLDRAVAFYRDVLGMRLLFQAPPSVLPRYGREHPGADERGAVAYPENLTYGKGDTFNGTQAG